MTNGFTTFQIGEYAEANVLADLIHLGHQIAIPKSANSPWDVGIVLGDRLVRIQVKNAHLKNGVIDFATCPSRPNVQGYTGQCELIVCYCPGTMKCYAVETRRAPGKSMRLRLKPAATRVSRKRFGTFSNAGRQKKGINMAEDFLLEKVLAQFIQTEYPALLESHLARKISQRSPRKSKLAVAV